MVLHTDEEDVVPTVQLNPSFGPVQVELQYIGNDPVPSSHVSVPKQSPSPQNTVQLL